MFITTGAVKQAKWITDDLCLVKLYCLKVIGNCMSDKFKIGIGIYKISMTQQFSK